MGVEFVLAVAVVVVVVVVVLVVVVVVVVPRRQTRMVQRCVCRRDEKKGLGTIAGPISALEPMLLSQLLLQMD
jgi:hypothetical protein